MSTIYGRLGVLLLFGVAFQLTLPPVECKQIIHQDLNRPSPPEHDILRIPNPCPADVTPCTCSFDGTSTPIKLSLQCFGLGQGDLKNVFGKFASMKTFTSLDVMMSSLGDLTQDTFNDVTFREMNFIDAGLKSDGGSFQDSKGTLTSIMIVDNSYDPLDWPLSDDFSAFTSLETLIVTGPYKGPTKPLNFPSITTLSLSAREMDTVDDKTFSLLSNVKTLSLKETKIDTLPANVFSALKKLEVLQVVHGALTTLNDHSLHVTADNIQTIDLYFNEIDKVNPKAFEVSKKDVNIDLKSNQITALKQPDLEPLVTGYGTVYVEGNPFNCDCDDDMVWVINTHIDAALEELDGAYDQCKFPADVDPVVLKKFYEYQCSTS
ncbi:uncharacterized protein LOC143020879 [Oratosquilla oratoria]|uniref:uncharacterized protein LOC143020879 n=1 Tax=Oratosquilla oratoria TaxID=337810 RepID=UPI003F762F62